MEKDMELAKYELYILPTKIPILFDDKPFWAKNGFEAIIILPTWSFQDELFKFFDPF